MENSNKEPIEVSEKAGCAIVRFSRPEKKNPLSIATLDLLEKRFDQLIASEHIEGIILTGSGDTFAAGANLNEIRNLDGEEARGFGKRGQNLLQKINRSSKTTIAAIDGFCMGGAFDLAVSCRVRIATPRSVFAHPGVNLGIITGWGGTQMLPRLIGESRALELLLTGRRLLSDDALIFGILDEISNNPIDASVSKIRSI